MYKDAPGSSIRCGRRTPLNRASNPKRLRPDAPSLRYGPRLFVRSVRLVQDVAPGPGLHPHSPAAVQRAATAFNPLAPGHPSRDWLTPDP